MVSMADMPGETVAGPGEVPLQDARVLVVDDLRSSRMLIGSVLKAAGFTNVEYAADGVEAIEQVKAYDPDILLLDIVMPRMDGFEVCEHIRQEMKSDVPILVQSGVQEGEQRVKAFAAGASDLVSKPINAGEMISRLKLHVERRRLVDRLKRYRQRMEDELKNAEAMQLSLLPSPGDVETIAAARGVHLEAFYRASNQLGGDLWTIFAIDDARFGVFVVDLSGHGVTAAINAFRLHVLIEAHGAHRDDPSKWLSGLSAELYDMLPVEHFATGFYGVFDSRTRTLTYAAAGAPAPVLLRAGGTVELIDASGLIMGCTDQADYPNVELKLEAGDRFCLYSDALYEDFNDPEASLEPEEIGAHIAAAAGAPKGEFPQALMRRVYGTVPNSLPDDLTILMMEIAG